MRKTQQARLNFCPILSDFDLLSIFDLFSIFDHLFIFDLIQSCQHSEKPRKPIFENLIHNDNQPNKKHRGKAKTMAEDERSFVEQFSDRLRRFLIGGDTEYPHDYRSSSKLSHIV